MAGFLRLLIAVALWPCCWALSRALWDGGLYALGASRGGYEGLSFWGGALVFVASWYIFPRPVKTYVLGHELTHALWGLLFGARPSRLRVGASGGSVNLTKTNVLITLAPYFFPFYTFCVLLIYFITSLFVRPVPYPAVWFFAVGWTWAFHILFTFDALGRRQSDVQSYGRLFSWTFITGLNLIFILIWLTVTTSLTFAQLGAILKERMASAYTGVYAAGLCGWHKIGALCSQI